MIFGNEKKWFASYHVDATGTDSRNDSYLFIV